jgi:uncharacterized protein YbaP (TraB family)
MFEKNSSLIFIVGTLHLLTPADFPLPEAFDIAYQQPDEVIFEASMVSMILFITELQQLGFTGLGALETIEQQLNFITEKGKEK